MKQLARSFSIMASAILSSTACTWAEVAPGAQAPRAIDTALSIHQTLFHTGLAFPTGGTKLVAYFRSYQRLTDHWRNVLPPERFIEVEYEALTREPDPMIRRIIADCGLTWDEACLRPERNPRLVKTPSKWQTRQPIYRHSVERWRRYEPCLGPLRALLDGAMAPTRT